MSIVMRIGRTRRTLVALAMVAVAGVGVGLAWAGQVSTVRVCEEDDPARCEGADARLQHSSANPASPNFDAGVFPNDGPNVGFSLVTGYLNGDGFADLLVGAPGEDRVYVILGGVDLDVAAAGAPDRSSELETTADLILQGEAGSGFGHSVAVGPHNGMTSLSNPVIIGAPRWTDGTGTPGRAYALPASFWSAPGASPVDITGVGSAVTLTGEADGDEAGYAVGIGPVLNAGDSDRIVTARRANGGAGGIYAVAEAAGSGNLSAAAQAVAGNSVDPCVALDTCVGTETFPVDEGLGEFIAIADFQDDGGRHEVAVSAVGVDGNDSTPGNIPGHVYIFDMTNAPAVADDLHRIVGGAVNDFFGFSLAGGSLIAGAGPELAVGAIYADRDATTCDLSTRTNVGAAYVFDSSVVATVAAGMGPADVLDAETTYRGQFNWDEFGFSVALGVTAHTSGTYDLAVSARRADRSVTMFNQVDEGAVYLFANPLAIGEQCLDCVGGDCSVNPPAADAVVFGGDYTTEGAGASDEIGFSIAFGDLNGGDVGSPDGRLFDDLAIASVTQERVYLVALENSDDPASDGAETDALRDIEDRDDDGDGYDDTDEDFNTNGSVDLQESDALTPNRDVTVAVTTANAGDNLDCDGSIAVTVTVTNASPVLTVLDPQLQITIPGGPFEYEAGSTDILLNGTFVTDVNDGGGGAFPFAAARSMTQDGSARTSAALNPGQTLAVSFQLNLPVQLDWAEAQIASGDVDAVVSLVAPDLNELPFPHAGGISLTNNASHTINLRRPDLDIEKASFLLASDTNGELNAGETYGYTITIQNNGNLAARNVVLSDVVDANAVLDTGSVTVTCGTCSSTNITLPATAMDPLLVSMDNIGAGSQALVSFQVTADEDLANNAPIVNQATIAEVCLEERYSDSSDAAINDAADIGNDPALTDDDDPNTDTVSVFEQVALQGNVAANPEEVTQQVTYSLQATTGANGTVRLNNIMFSNVPAQTAALCLPTVTPPISGDNNNDQFLDWAETGNGAETWNFSCNYTIPDTVAPTTVLDNWIRITGTTPDGGTVTDDINIQLTVLNSTPVANDDPTAGTIDVAYNGIIDINALANDTDANENGGDTLSYNSVDASTSLGGSAAIVACGANPAGCIRYTAPDNAGAGQTDSFQYDIVDDFTGVSNTATVTVVIGAEPTVAIDDVTLDEGNGNGTTNFNFSVTLTGDTGQYAVTGDADTMAGSATAGDDYTTVSMPLNFTADTTGPQTIMVTVPVDADNVFEDEETFTVIVSLDSPMRAMLLDASGLGTIQNDDGAPTISVADVSIAEGDAGQTMMTFTVVKTGSTVHNFTVRYDTNDLTATAGSDYTALTNGTLDFQSAVSQLDVIVMIDGDMDDELDENFELNLSNINPASRANFADDQAIGTIKNDELSLAITDYTAVETDAGTTMFVFDVNLTDPGATTNTVTVDWETVDGTATAGSDYTAVTPTTLTFMPGETTKQVMVEVSGDTDDEPDETFDVVLTNEVNAVFANAGDETGTGTIKNDELSLFITNYTAAETNAGTTMFTFDVNLTDPGATTNTVTVDWETADGTATAGSDYTAVTPTTLTFMPGETTKQVMVEVSGDTDDEPDETFDVVLTNEVNAVFANAGDETGTGTIRNDELTLAVTDVSVVEGTGGTTTFTFDVNLTDPGATTNTVTVDWETADGTATAGSDYTAVTPTTLTFMPGETTKQIMVDIAPDGVFENNETFTVELSNPVNAIISDTTGDGTIENDDTAPTIDIGDVMAAEDSGSFDFTVTQSAISEVDTTVNFTTIDGTATTADSDYTMGSGTGVVVVPAGMMAGTISVSVTTDNKFELNETFDVTISGAVGASIGDGTGTGTITNDDSMPTISIDNPMTAEGDTGENPVMNFTVTLSNPSDQAITVDFATGDDAPVSATAGVDYVATSGSGGTALMIPAEATMAMLPVTLNGDLDVETDETFLMTLSNPVGASFAGMAATLAGTGTILENDIVRIAPQPPVFESFDGDQINWGVVPQAQDYHLYRGNLDELRSSGIYTQNQATVDDAKHFCFLDGTGQTDTHAPAAGGVLFYLITADDGFMESQLGRNAAGDLRPNTDPCR